MVSSMIQLTVVIYFIISVFSIFYLIHIFNIYFFVGRINKENKISIEMEEELSNNKQFCLMLEESL